MKNRDTNDVAIKEGDIVCQSCISYANRFRPKESKPAKTARSLTIDPLFLEATTSGYSERQSDLTQINDEIAKIKVNIPRTKSTHSSCVICNLKNNLTTVSNEAYMDAFIERNILIPKGN